MKKITTIILLGLVVMQPIRLAAQEFSIGADLVTTFMWRGMKCADASFQPYMTIDMGKFSFMAWNNTNLNDFGQDVDLFLSYEDKGFRIEVADYFVEAAGEKFNYFDYKAHSTNHMFDATVSYQLSGKLPIKFLWSTIFAGDDYCKVNGDRAYSSYLEVSYPFTAKGIDFNAEVGITPWEGMYADDFNLVNIGLEAAKKVKITETISLPISIKFIANPAEERTHIVFAVNF
ncbi:hypothetical protein D0T50_07955 [Bacteroides sp. 214]|uniref:hypothetical protein n=1 Tax=Bacteroides sp. 214 TaxID=2302935 RepID=UPI0013D76C47|nr:hypothetical protein [Bacteroides sp. 214]NDW12823.1 hypothetical protein [Bacteroides sp. 214]